MSAGPSITPSPAGCQGPSPLCHAERWPPALHLLTCRLPSVLIHPGSMTCCASLTSTACPPRPTPTCSTVRGWLPLHAGIALVWRGRQAACFWAEADLPTRQQVCGPDARLAQVPHCLPPSRPTPQATLWTAAAGAWRSYSRCWPSSACTRRQGRAGQSAQGAVPMHPCNTLEWGASLLPFLLTLMLGGLAAGEITTSHCPAAHCRPACK